MRLCVQNEVNQEESEDEGDRTKMSYLDKSQQAVSKMGTIDDSKVPSCA